MFSRLSVLIGKQGIEALKNKRILVFGLGGVGGHCCDALARSGIIHFGIVDNDVVAVSNLNRQIIATQDSLGRKKVDAMEAHLKSINPEIEITKYDMLYLPECADKIDLSGYDYVIDAIDTVAAKIDIIARCYELGIPVISAAPNEHNARQDQHHQNRYQMFFHFASVLLISFSLKPTVLHTWLLLHQTFCILCNTELLVIKIFFLYHLFQSKLLAKNI